MDEKVSLKKLRHAMYKRLNLDDLRVLCFDINDEIQTAIDNHKLSAGSDYKVDFEQLEGTTLTDKVTCLFEYLENRKLLEYLVGTVEISRPEIYKEALVAKRPPLLEQVLGIIRSQPIPSTIAVLLVVMLVIFLLAAVNPFDPSNQVVTPIPSHTAVPGTVQITSTTIPPTPSASAVVPSAPADHTEVPQATAREPIPTATSPTGPSLDGGSTLSVNCKVKKKNDEVTLRQGPSSVFRAKDYVTDAMQMDVIARNSNDNWNNEIRWLKVFVRGLEKTGWVSVLDKHGVDVISCNHSIENLYDLLPPEDVPTPTAVSIISATATTTPSQESVPHPVATEPVESVPPPPAATSSLLASLTSTTSNVASTP